MASLVWTKNQNCKTNTRAPSSIFSSNNNLSPRQIATKACTLAIKKLDRDDKRSRPQYNVRERLLLCNTLSNAEKFLQKRTLRTNRRVMAFEEDDTDSPIEDRIVTTPPQVSSIDYQDSTANHHYYDQSGHHSPLCHMEETYIDNVEEDHQTAPTYVQQQQQQQQQEYDAQYMTLEMALQSQSYSPTGNDALVIPQDDEDIFDHPMTPGYSQQQQHQQPQFMTLEMALQSKSHSPMGNDAFVIPQDDEDFLQYPPSFLIPNQNPNVLSSECRPLAHQNPHSSPIASII